MRPELLLLLVGLAYALIFRLLAWLRREMFSLQFIFEAVILTVVGAGLAYLGIFVFNPIVFVLLLYLITMRARLLVDLANLLARSGRFRAAERIYGLARGLGPDAPSRLVISMNQGAALILEGRTEEGIGLLKEVLETPDLSPKHLASVHYNLGVAYRHQGNNRESVHHLREAIEAMPGSIYARHAQALLKKRSGKKK